MLPMTGTGRSSSQPISFTALSMPCPGRPTAFSMPSSMTNMFGAGWPLRSSWHRLFSVTAPAPSLPMRATPSLDTPRMPEARIVGLSRLTPHSVAESMLQRDVLPGHDALAELAPDAQGRLLDKLEDGLDRLLVGDAVGVGAEDAANLFWHPHAVLLHHLVILDEAHGRVGGEDGDLLHLLFREVPVVDLDHSFFPQLLAVEVEGDGDGVLEFLGVEELHHLQGFPAWEMVDDRAFLDGGHRNHMFRDFHAALPSRARCGPALLEPHWPPAGSTRRSACRQDQWRSRSLSARDAGC